MQAECKKELSSLFTDADEENGLTNSWNGMSRQEFEEKAFPDMLRFSKGENLPNWMVPEDEFYLRANWDNPASLKVMMKNGGRIATEDDVKYYVRIKNPGKGLTTIEMAQALLAEAGKLNPGAWEQHSIYVREGARRIANGDENLAVYLESVLYNRL